VIGPVSTKQSYYTPLYAYSTSRQPPNVSMMIRDRKKPARNVITVRGELESANGISGSDALSFKQYLDDKHRLWIHVCTALNNGT